MKEASFIKFMLIYWFAAKLSLVVLPTLTVSSTDWLIPIIVSSIYIMIGVFILLARGPLVDYKMDFVSVVIFLMFATFLRYDIVPDNTLSIVFKVIVWVICGVILFRMLTGQIRLAYPSWSQVGYIFVGVLSGLLLAGAEAFVIVHKPDFHTQPAYLSFYSSADYLVREFAYEASNAAVLEEFAFRGLFWAYLAKQSFGERTAYLVQALLFWLSHLDRALTSPTGFWFVLPVSTVIFTLLAWRSRSLVASINAHTVSNALQSLFAAIMAVRL
jgi:hypothetical protein